METATRRVPGTATLRRLARPLVTHPRTVAGATLGLTLSLLLLGEFTAAAGAGATCNQTYPGCAGQLSPIGLTLPQFIEWFHRLVAMLVGYVILGNAVVLWRTFPGTRISRAGWLAAALLPLQVVFGGITVTFANLVPGGYAPPVQLLHFTAGFAIFLSLLLAFVWVDAAVGRGATVERVYLLAVAGIGLTGFQAVFARDLVYTFWPSIQVLYQFFGHLAIAAFVAAALHARDIDLVDGAVLGALGAAVGLGGTYLVLGIFVITASIEAVTYLLLAVQFALFVVLAIVAARATPRSA